VALERTNTNYNNPVSPISLNTEDFALTVEIIRDVTDIGQKDRNSINQILHNDYIKEYSFTSDLAYPIITGNMVFQDQGSFLFSKITADGRTFMSFTLEKVGRSNVSAKIERFSHIFIITKIDMLERFTEESTYRISFVSLEWYKFNNYLNYSSEGDKPVLNILEELVKTAGLKLKPNKETKQVNRSQFFITPTSYTLLDSIRYLLSIAVDSDNGFYFFNHDHIKNEYNITSLKQLYSKLRNGENDELNVNNIFILPSVHFIATGVIGRQGIQEFTELNMNGADVTTELLKPFSFQTYDYITRSFKEVNINFNKLAGTLPTPQSNSYRNNINPPLKEITDINNFNYQRERDPINSFSYYFSVAKLFMWNRVAEFKVFGNIERKAGDLIFISIPEADEHYEQLNGYWYILRCSHEFDKKTYYNYIQACRVDHSIAQTNKKVQFQQGGGL
jgi:hypothetical protein